MPYWDTHYHLVWATHQRADLIEPEIESALYHVIAAKIVELTGRPCCIGGTSNHLHVVCAIPPKLPVSELVGQIKGASSHLMNHSLGCDGAFRWQREYGLLTVSRSQLARVEDYVRNQKAHHHDHLLDDELERIDE
jgi:REP element-mobilizing transposase RayT